MTSPERRRALLEDSEVAANIARLSGETGIPVERYLRLLRSDPPPGISSTDWLDALLDRGRHHYQWSERMLQQLSRMATEPRRDSAA